MKEELKLYCESEYRNVKYYRYDWQCAVDRAYGAVMFFLNCTCVKESDQDEIAEWWESEMRERFYILRG